MLYHVFNRSIANFIIFNNAAEFFRMINLIKYYRRKEAVNFSRYADLMKCKPEEIINTDELISKENDIVQIVCYCLMPTHFHLIIKELTTGGTSTFTMNILNSYTRYFNIKHNRKGPLWESRSKKVLIETDEQLLHLTRYIHLNPVTSYLSDKPEDWVYSSYKEYVSNTGPGKKICDYRDYLLLKPDIYEKFIYEGISYQRELAKSKKLG